MDSGFSVANGITTSPDGKKLYVSNMLQGEVFVYDLEQSSGEIRNKRVFARIPEANGFPDGLTIDIEGFVWIAHWKGSSITRHHPDTGEVAAEISLPVRNVTRATFGGSELDELLIMSAWHGCEPELPNQPLAGDVFSYKPGVSGLPEQQFLG
jgi:sugar lactone lactonase YvrE